MDTEIKFVSSQEEKQEIYRFRYEVYVEELNRHQLYADTQKRCIEEPLDKNGHLLIARDQQGKVIGTARHNYARDDNELTYYSKLYQMYRVGSFHPSHSFITTKLMVAKEYRKSSLAKKILLACYRKALEDKVRFNFIDVNTPLFKFFLKFGYKFLDKIVHPEYGEVSLMCLDVEDAEHLLSVRSPFYKMLCEFK